MQSDPTAAPTEGLAVIGAGFGRTGTYSMKLALEALGFGPCYHMVEIFDRPERDTQWNQIIAGEAADWPAVFAGYRSTVDWPACSFYMELMEAYPAAKVLLTVRDPDAWYESVLATIYRTREIARPFDLAESSASPAAAEEANARLISRKIWVQTFGDRFEDRDHAIAVYRAHNEEVIRHVPAERLLVYEAGSGWEALCTFLGVAVPADQPFPQVNDRASFQARMQARIAAEPRVSGAGHS